jgi:hypothetical protein
MNGVASGLFGNGDDLLDIKVRRYTLPLQGVGLVRHSCMQRAGVICGKYRYRPQAQFRGGSNNTNGDFATVGNQKSF